MPRVRIMARSFAVLFLVVALVGGALSCSGASEPPVIVIGLDGADWDLLLPWLEAGKLPNLKAFLDESLAGELTTVLPILSPVCWTSACTGVNPGKHGIYDFQRTDPQNPTATLIEQATNRRALPVWMLLSDLGYRVGVMNVPMTFPPDPVRGDMISGFPFPSGDVNITYPPELQGELGDYPIDHLGLNMKTRGPDELYRDFRKALDIRGDVAGEWIRSGDYDFMWFVFTAPDKVQHFFWKYMDPEHPQYTVEEARDYGNAIEELWIRQDEILGDLMAVIPSDARVLLMSDHGFDGIYRQVNMANFMQDTRLVSWLETHAIPPMLITNGLLHYVLQGQLVGSSDREEFIDIFTEVCAELKDPKTGKAPFEKIFRREDIYEGRSLEKAPDVVFYENPNFFVARGDTAMDLPWVEDVWATSFSAYHRPEGILAVRGPGFKAPGGGSGLDRLRNGGDFQGANIMDVAPTILNLYCQTIPDQMDGRVLSELLAADSCPVHIAEVPGFLMDRSPPKLSETEREALKSIPYIN